MTEILDNNINQHFQELIIRTLGIITRNKTQKHIKITFNPLKELFKQYYKDDIWWKFQVKDSVPWLCFWSKKLSEEPANGIYPMFYSYSGKQNGQNIKYLILAFGKSVKKEPKINWDSRLPLKNINDFFNELNIKELPSYKNEINYGSSMIYKVYEINQEKFNDINFQNQIFNDFQNLFEYYLTYAKYITYEKNYNKIIESKEELEAILPYSKESFTIPKNLYILGTMNTADRSIALLDIALRRRFNFIEMMPKYDILKDIKINNIDLALLLSTINERIEFLLDREHTIGHSYFLNINTFEDLIQVFRNSIIPLLQEYFYDDFEKIKSVLGDNNFISSKNISINLKGNNQKKYIYKIDEEALKVPENYQKIYSSNEDEE